ncbi:hypothetical protein LQW54_011952 [Pestalotiopsis sp. IQ-011]
MGEQQENFDKGVHEINKQKSDPNKEVTDRGSASEARELLKAKDDKIGDLLATLEQKKQDLERKAHRAGLVALEYLNKHIQPGHAKSVINPPQRRCRESMRFLDGARVAWALMELPEYIDLKDPQWLLAIPDCHP